MDARPKYRFFERLRLEKARASSSARKAGKHRRCRGLLKVVESLEAGKYMGKMGDG
jgi:hypothetical protein